jgi:hypothetical protein
MARPHGYENIQVSDVRVIAKRDRLEAQRIVGVVRAAGDPWWEVLSDALTQDDVDESRHGYR